MHRRFAWLFAALLFVIALRLSPSAQLLSFGSLDDLATKLDPGLQARVGGLSGESNVIVRFTNSDGLGVASLVQQVGGSVGRALPLIGARVMRVPNSALALVALNPAVAHVSLDRPIVGAMQRTGGTVGAASVRAELGLTGAGIGIAIIDSGVTAWHDDLADGAGAQRVSRFVDFVNGATAPYDDYGHGTHVAGIITGNGFDSSGARSGMAPGAHLVVLKVLDGNGHGRISDVIAAVNYAVEHKDALGIRIINLSIASGVYESYDSDPLTLAALAAVQSGVVVVAAAGNNGRSRDGHVQYGGITSPGNAPWVLTVGASSHMGTVDRADDTMAAFSSRGPAAIDYDAKPDLVAPGVGIESLSDPASAFYTKRSAHLLDGTIPTPYRPYLSLSGTSMASPVVSGIVALMLEANPALTPNAVKAILQYTAQEYPGYDALTQGAGFVNAKGAVQLARFFADPASGIHPSASDWSGRIVWGNRLFTGGSLMPAMNAWSTDVVWGASRSYGERIAWGAAGSNVWDTASPSRNVVWGTVCGGADCHGTWFVSAAGADGDTVVWGTDAGDTVVWGTSCEDPSCEPRLWQK